MALDLHAYGLNWILDPETMTSKYTPNTTIYSKAKRADDNISILIGGQEKKFRINGDKLGSGSFGVTYLVDDLNGDPTPKVVKIIKKPDDFDTNPAYYLREAVIQIIVVKETENERYPEINLYGPFAPRLFYIGVDKTYYYIVIERLTNTLKVKSRTADVNEYKKYLIQIAKILQVLYDKLQFNHRDLKFDNIMYNLNPNNTENIKLIDFGLACLNYKGIQIFHPRGDLQHCYKISRDVSSILYLIINYTNIDKSSYVYKIIHTLLKSQSGIKPLSWNNSYKTYNSLSDYKNLYPEVIYNIFTKIDSSNYNTWVNYVPEINTGLINLTTDEELRVFKIDRIIQFICENPQQLYKLKESRLLFFLDYALTSEKLLNCIISTEEKYSNMLEIIIKKDKIDLFERVVQKLNYPDKTIFQRIIKIRQIPEAFLRAISMCPDFLSNINKPNSAGLTPLESVFSEKNIVQINWLLGVSGINLQFRDSTALIEAFANIHITEITPIVDKILEINNTPEFINYITKTGNSAIQLIFGKNMFALLNKLLSLEGFSVTYTNTTLLIALIKRFPTMQPSTYIENIPKSKFTPEYVSYNNSLALKLALDADNLPLAKYLVEAGSEIPTHILSYLGNAKKPLIDYIFSIANKPEYINAIYSGDNKDFKYKSVLMIAVKHRNLYLVSKLLEFPELKTGYRNPLDGKTVLHYAALASSNLPGNFTRMSLGEVPEHKILKLLIDRNPALTETKNNFKKGPSNPSYVGYGFTRRYIKSRKSGMFSRKHNNTNLTGGRRLRQQYSLKLEKIEIKRNIK